MSGPAEPRNGARFLFRRQLDPEEPVRYLAELLLPERVVRYDVVFDGASCSVTRLGEATTPAPPWAEDHLRALASQLGRTGERSGTWPRRLLRWREA